MKEKKSEKLPQFTTLKPVARRKGTEHVSEHIDEILYEVKTIFPKHNIIKWRIFQI